MDQYLQASVDMAHGIPDSMTGQYYMLLYPLVDDCDALNAASQEMRLAADRLGYALVRGIQYVVGGCFLRFAAADKEISREFILHDPR